jgi:predicted MFS family arabinose efflux permease
MGAGPARPGPVGRLLALAPDYRRLLLATLFFGASSGIFMSTLNNYLADVHALGASQRGLLELPRELPGFSMIFIAAGLLALMSETRMAAVAMALTGVGALGLGNLVSSTFALVLFMVVWSMGDHIIFTVEAPIGLSLARSGAEGQRLGQIGGARNVGVILGVGTIYLITRSCGDRYGLIYLVAACSAFLAGICYFRMRQGAGPRPARRIVLKRKYSLFYGISALFGLRKQIFLAFGGWVLVRNHGVQVSTIALLFVISAALGIVARPVLGEIIDRLGERAVLALDEALLLAICLAYAFASDVFPSPVDLYVLFGAYVVDNVSSGLRMANTTYLKKIADDPSDVTPSVSVGVTIDHLVSMSFPVLSGYVWERFGFRWVFIIIGTVAVFGFFLCLQVRVPARCHGR